MRCACGPSEANRASMHSFSQFPVNSVKFPDRKDSRSFGHFTGKKTGNPISVPVSKIKKTGNPSKIRTGNPRLCIHSYLLMVYGVSTTSFLGVFSEYFCSNIGVFSENIWSII